MFKSKAQKAKTAFTKQNVSQLLTDLPRHDTFEYVNKNSLHADYFAMAYASLIDENIYLVISNTGSPASEIISVFTDKMYNHASISFDAELNTLVSFNGGEQISPPGLNAEKIASFNKKDDASAVVYRLPVTREQKETMIHKVEQINDEGSSYNLVGLLFNYSHKSNIMYCSQFVYGLLKSADAAYFEKSGGIKPTDFIERDENNVLTFVKEIKFNK